MSDLVGEVLEALDTLRDKHEQWENAVRLTKIRIEDRDTRELSEIEYGQLLEPGTIIWMYNSPYFYSGYTWLDGKWIDESGGEYSPYMFLVDILNRERRGYYASTTNQKKRRCKLKSTEIRDKDGVIHDLNDLVRQRCVIDTGGAIHMSVQGDYTVGSYWVSNNASRHDSKGLASLIRSHSDDECHKVTVYEF
nr:MAG TPA: hypothetical protein [Caudoviricetes sp.]